MKEPVYPALLLFRREQEEYIVIATEGPVSDHAKPGFQFQQALEIDDCKELVRFPTDTTLTRK